MDTFNFKSSKMSKIVGIDLGTTNSVVAILEGSTPLVITNAEGSRTTPSIVAHSIYGDTLVGQLAKRQSIINPENTFYSVKRFMGCKFSEVKTEISQVAYQVKSDENDKVKIYSPLLDKSFSPEEISALILKKLATDASAFLKEKVTQAVITVPAYYGDNPRTAVKDAGAIAGLDVLRIINEPTAAALAYGVDKKKNETILIFDLGGGTFDVSILEVGEEVFEVLATSGDTHLGGDDFDAVIVNHILESFKLKEGVDLRKDKQALQRIIEASEKAKIELSNLKSTQISLPFICIDGATPKSIELQLDRSKFEELSLHLLTRCKEPIEKALRDAKIDKKKLDEIILVGGSTRIPAVKNFLADFLNKPLNQSVNPDEVVAMGAAIQAGVLAGEITDLILLDVTPLSLGIETLGGVMTTVIPRNSSVPAKQSEIFSTAQDSQSSVDVHILQGERPFAKDNRSLGIFKLDGIPAAPKGIPRINVTFQLDVDGILSVSAREEESGKEQSIRIEGSSNLNRDEVFEMIKEAEQNSKADLSKKFLTSFMYELDNVLFKYEIASEKIKEIFPSASYETTLLMENTLNLIKKSFLKNEISLLKSVLIPNLRTAQYGILFEFFDSLLSK